MATEIGDVPDDVVDGDVEDGSAAPPPGTASEGKLFGREIFGASTYPNMAELERRWERYGSSGRLDVNYRDSEGRTAVVQSARGGHCDILRFLVQTCNADVNVATNNGWTALHFAAMKGNVDVIECLLSLGADPLQPTHRGNLSAIDVCVSYKRHAAREVLERFVAKPAVKSANKI